MSSISAKTFDFDKYLKEEHERSQGDRQADKDLAEEQTATLKKTIQDNYGSQIADTEESYEHKFRENAVQKLINERQIAENMSNLGLTDSGLNRTQMTANQLSYANNNAEYSRQKQKAVDKLNTAMTQLLTEADTKLSTTLNDIDKAYDETDYKNAASRYTTDVEAETDRVNALIEAETDRINAQISANTAAEKERNSALNSLYPKLFDVNATDEEKIAHIKAFILSNGVYEDSEIERLEDLAGLPKGSVYNSYGINKYAVPTAPKPLNEQTWEPFKITRVNWGGGIDNNSKVRSVETGEIIRLDKLKDKLKSELNMTEEQAKQYILNLQDQIGIKS